jgi:hypothetical protein
MGPSGPVDSSPRGPRTEWNHTLEIRLFAQALVFWSLASANIAGRPVSSGMRYAYPSPKRVSKHVALALALAVAKGQN